MDNKNRVLLKIKSELNRAESALREGNEGMARVCARRACGAAIEYWLETNEREHYGKSAMNLLRSIQEDETIPEKIKDAAGKLTTHITKRGEEAFTDNPIADAKAIIDYFIKE